MQRKDPDISFSAYVGTDEGPQRPVRPKTTVRYKAPIPAGPADARSNRGRLWILSLVLLASSATLFMQHAEALAEYINSPIVSVRMETPLQRVGEMEVRSVLAQHLGKGFFGLDVGALKTELENHPWIEMVVIRRVWPDALAGAVREEVPIARWGDDGLLNQQAAVFKPAVIDAGISLPMLRGPAGTHPMMMEQYQLFNQLLLTSGLRIRELSLNERGSWSVTVTDGVVVNIGREYVLERLQRFITFHDKHMHTEMGNLRTVDLRYRNGISVSMKEVESGVAAL